MTRAQRKCAPGPRYRELTENAIRGLRQQVPCRRIIGFQRRVRLIGRRRPDDGHAPILERQDPQWAVAQEALPRGCAVRFLGLQVRDESGLLVGPFARLDPSGRAHKGACAVGGDQQVGCQGLIGSQIDLVPLIDAPERLQRTVEAQLCGTVIQLL